MAKPKATGGTVSISISDDGLNGVVSGLLGPLSTKFQLRANKASTLAALDVVKRYYSREGSKLWVNPNGLTHGPGRVSTQWWRGVAGGWNATNVKARSSEIINKTIGLSHKVTGGTIRAKRVKMLTIPVTPTAHGHTAKTYSRTIAPLFRVKNALVMSTPDGGIKPVFALKKSVTQAPWPDALPPEKTYAKAYYDTLLNMIEMKIVGTKEDSK